MQNTRLQLLLERAPINDEDRHNISRIFSVLSAERQSQIITNWDQYITRFIAIRDQLIEDEARKFLSRLGAIDTLLDDAILRESEKEYQKNEQKKQIRAELESTIAFDQMQRLKHTRDILKTDI